MASGIYAVAHIGHLKLYVCDASNIHKKWPPILAQLNSGTHPYTSLQAVWNAEGGKRYFTFHTRKELASDRDILGIEKLLAEQI
ncbi:MAG TPA: hypothetical protein DDZ80_25590 [Cyanobacteria bacterium UBA8803]|nr:hypothetical protein [Cyanobacteria bacterium UBA9273]HBL61668.1 hypothetical protein [Cyanobacteria bacterium UBA8803]